MINKNILKRINNNHYLKAKPSVPLANSAMGTAATNANKIALSSRINNDL